MHRSTSNIAQVGSTRHASRTGARLAQQRTEPAEFGIAAERIEFMNPADMQEGEPLRTGMHSTKHAITPLNKSNQGKTRHAPQTADKAQTFEELAGRQAKSSHPHHSKVA